MFASISCFCITLALCVAMGISEVLYKKSGQKLTLGCGDGQQEGGFEWKLDNFLILKMTKTGVLSKGPLYTPRTKLSGNKLKFDSVQIGDNGLYSCSGYDGKGKFTNTSQHTLHVMSVSVSPSSTVLISTAVTLTCNINGDSQVQAQWLKPPGHEPYKTPDKVITLKSVTLDDAGQWICQFKDDKGTVMEIAEVNITVVGPLISPGEVLASSGGAAELPCFLPYTGGLPIVGGGWTLDSPSDLQFPNLARDASGLHWNGKQSRVTFSDDKLCNDFNVALQDVQSSDAGVYVCTLIFENGNNLTTKLNLKVGEGGVLGHLEITAPLGGEEKLPCTPSTSSSLRVVGGGWSRDTPANFPFPTIVSTELKGLHWNGSNVPESKVAFSDLKLSTNFDVTLKNLQHADAGVYVCTLKFEDGKIQRTKLTLKVQSEAIIAAPDARPQTPLTKGGFWQKPVLLGLNLWIWITMAAGSLLLIVLVIVIVSVQCRSKRKRSIAEKNKLNAAVSCLQEDVPMNEEFQPKRTKPPRQGLRDRPLPPLPKHQYKTVKSQGMEGNAQRRYETLDIC